MRTLLLLTAAVALLLCGCSSTPEPTLNDWPPYGWPTNTVTR